MKRPVSHTLEDASFAALRLLLPRKWVIHEYVNDYGIDVQIEIFNTEDQSTGIRFYGQLKATAKAVSADKLQLDREHLEYWGSHSDPVAVFRYHDVSQSFKWCWAHEIESQLKASADSVEISSYLHQWDAEKTPNAITAFLDMQLDCLRGGLPNQVSLDIRSTNAALDKSLLHSKLLREKLPFQVFKINSEMSTPAHFQIIFDAEKIRITHLGLPGFVIHTTTESSDDELANSAVLFLFLLTFRYQRKKLASALSLFAQQRLCQSCHDYESQGIARIFIEALVYSCGLKAAFKLISQTPILSNERANHFVLLNVGLHIHKKYDETEAWIDVLRNWVASPLIKNSSGADAYNLANALSHQGFWEEALQNYIKAAELETSYLERDYYWREIGAAYFESSDFFHAVKAYKKALEITNTAETKWCLGDAYFRSGCYQKASIEFVEAEQANSELLPNYFQLVHIVCNELVSYWGIQEQRIIPIDSESNLNALQALEFATSQSDLKARLNNFMHICAIDPLLSFNMGHYSLQSSEQNVAFYRFLTCALINRTDAEAWAKVIAIAITNRSNSHSAPLVLQEGYRLAGEEVVSHVFETLNLNDAKNNGSAIEFKRQFLDLMHSIPPSAVEKPVLRVNGIEFVSSQQLDADK